MQTRRRKDLSIDIYHRIYRMASRKISTNQIAVTLNLPFSTVKSVVDKLSYTPSKKPAKVVHNDDAGAVEHPDAQSYLDVYLLQRLRCSIIDLNGMITAKHAVVLQAELDKIVNSEYKVVAILMTNVKDIDEVGFGLIHSFFDMQTGKGRYVGLLDPSLVVENYLTHHDLEKIIPVFGTEKAFEDNAFKTKKQK